MAPAREGKAFAVKEERDVCFTAWSQLLHRPAGRSPFAPHTEAEMLHLLTTWLEWLHASMRGDAKFDLSALVTAFQPYARTLAVLADCIRLPQALTAAMALPGSARDLEIAWKHKAGLEVSMKDCRRYSD